jgi:hypothetical protein
LRERIPEIRDMFQIQAIKGGQLSPRWGFSLVFVPHVKNGRLAWHRTVKSAQFDVIDDPLDLTLPETAPSLLLSCNHGPETLHMQASTLAPFAIAQADRFWQRVSSLQDLRLVFFELKARTGIRFDFYSYISHPVAFAFTLAKLGERASGQEELPRFIHFREGTTRLREQLLAAFDQASSQRGA